MRRLSLLATLLAFVFLGVASAAGKVTIDDPNNLLKRRGEVEAVARRLADKDVDVIVIVTQTDGSNGAGTPTSTESYINSRFQPNNLSGSLRALPGKTVLFYVSPGSQFDGLYYVSAFNNQLSSSTANNIRLQQMRPQFTRGDLDGGLIAGMNTVYNTLYPPTSPFTYGLIGVVVLGGLALVLGPRIRRGRAEAANLAGGQQRAEAARKATGVAIADLGQLVRTARDKAQYDRISYSSTDAQRVTELQLQGEQTFVQAQGIFDQAEQDQQLMKTPTVAAYDQIIAAYEQAHTLVEQAAGPLNEAERLRASLDQAAGSGGPTTGATQRL